MHVFGHVVKCLKSNAHVSQILIFFFEPRAGRSVRLEVNILHEYSKDINTYNSNTIISSCIEIFMDAYLINEVQ